jgi:hypothetical protein
MMPPFGSVISGSFPPTTQSSKSDEASIGQQEERPSQINFVRAAQMSLFANVMCWPPLEQVTFLKRKGEGTETNVKNKVCYPNIRR